MLPCSQGMTEHESVRLQVDSPDVYWHRELPPLGMSRVADDAIEATSTRIPGTIARHSDLWNRCYDELIKTAELRMSQELKRIGGACARVYDEGIDTRHDAATGEAWLHGRFTFTVYR